MKILTLRSVMELSRNVTWHRRIFLNAVEVGVRVYGIIGRGTI